MHSQRGLFLATLFSEIELEFINVGKEDKFRNNNKLKPYMYNDNRSNF